MRFLGFTIYLEVTRHDAWMREVRRQARVLEAGVRDAAGADDPLARQAYRLASSLSAWEPER